MCVAVCACVWLCVHVCGCGCGCVVAAVCGGIVRRYCLGVYADGSSGGVIGANAMMYHDVVFDLAHKRVGFARSTCAGAPDAPGLGGPGGFDTANTPGNYSKFIGAFERLCLVPWGAFCSVPLVRAHVCAVCVGCGRGCGHDWCCLGHRCLRGAHRLRGSKRLPRRPGSGESYTPTHTSLAPRSHHNPVPCTRRCLCFHASMQVQARRGRRFTRLDQQSGYGVASVAASLVVCWVLTGGLCAGSRSIDLPQIGVSDAIDMDGDASDEAAAAPAASGSAVDDAASLSAASAGEPNPASDVDHEAQSHSAADEDDDGESSASHERAVLTDGVDNAV